MKRMQRQSTTPKQIGELRGFFQRLCFALGPLGAGIILDVLDFVTFGPIGVFSGAVVGGCAGWILGAYERFDRNLRIAFAICAAAYMTIPFTEPIPVATLLVLMARFFQGPRRT
jgi:hypothetical protein